MMITRQVRCKKCGKMFPLTYPEKLSDIGRDVISYCPPCLHTEILKNERSTHNDHLSPQAKRVHLPEVVGKGYGTFWNFKGRYRVCKGSRASKKSKTTALNIIKRMMQYPEANP